MLRRFVSPWMALYLLCACTSTASAQVGQAADTAPEADDYHRLVEKGLSEYQLGNWSEAKSFFAQAHAVQPNARTLRGLGLASYEMRSYVEAIGFFEEALANDVRPLTEGMRAQVQELLAQSRNFIARFELSGMPDGATLEVDGADPVFDGDGRLMLDRGRHELVVRAAGYEPLTRHVNAKAGQQEALQLAPQPIVQQVVQNEPGYFESRTTQHWIGLGAAAAGVVSLGVSGAFSLVALSHLDASEPDCDGNRCNDAGIAARNDARSAGDIATVTAITGGVLVAGGAIVYLLAGDTESAPETETALRWSPTLGRGQAGVQLSGVFQ